MCLCSVICVNKVQVDDILCPLLQVPHGISITGDFLIRFHYFLYLEEDGIAINALTRSKEKNTHIHKCQVCAFTSTLIK